MIQNKKIKGITFKNILLCLFLQKILRILECCRLTKYSEPLRSGAYPGVRNFPLILIGNGESQDRSSVCNVIVKLSANQSQMENFNYIIFDINP